MRKPILVIFLIFFIVIIAAITSFIIIGLEGEVTVKKDSYLTINLTGDIPEEIIDYGGFPIFEKPLTIKDLLINIRKAKHDKKIKGIYVKIYPLTIGWAKAQEIRDYLEDFSSPGKKVVTFIEMGGNLEYYLASCSKINLLPTGLLLIKGFASEHIFFKNTLDKLGIKAELEHIGDYKTASNIFTENKFTDAHREMANSLLDDYYERFIRVISESRKKDLQETKKIIEEGPYLPEETLKKGLIDSLAYEDQILNEIKKEGVDFVDIKKYSKVKFPLTGKKKIAIVYGLGAIDIGESGKDSMFGAPTIGSDTMRKILNRVKDDKSIKAVVLRIDSPGGSAIASDVIFRAEQTLKEKKPVVVSMSDLAGSGGYWISLGSNYIISQPWSFTGSIGVISGKFSLKGFYDKIGITKEIISRGKYAELFSDYKEFSAEERAKIIEEMKWIYGTFLKRVSESRSMKVEEIDKIGKGRVWTGEQAKKLKLIDEVGGILKAIEVAKFKANIPKEEEVTIEFFPKRRTLWQLLFNSTNKDAYQINVNLKHFLSIPFLKSNFYSNALAIMPWIMLIN